MALLHTLVSTIGSIACEETPVCSVLLTLLRIFEF
jgi:hypothetical protein